MVGHGLDRRARLYIFEPRIAAACDLGRKEAFRFPRTRLLAGEKTPGSSGVVRKGLEKAFLMVSPLAAGLLCGSDGQPGACFMPPRRGFLLYFRLLP